MVLLLATLSLIKITQGYSLKKHGLNFSWRMRLLDKKPCLNSMASLYCRNNTAILLVSSPCGTWVLLWRYLGQTECVGSMLPGEQVSMWPFPHSPLASLGVLCLVTACSGVCGLDKGWLMSDFPSHSAEQQCFSQALRPGKRTHGEGEAVKR